MEEEAQMMSQEFASRNSYFNLFPMLACKERCICQYTIRVACHCNYVGDYSEGEGKQAEVCVSAERKRSPLKEAGIDKAIQGRRNCR